MSAAEPAPVRRLHEDRSLSPEASAALLARIEELDADNVNLRKTNRGLRSTITRLQGELDRERGEGIAAETVTICLRFWKDRTSQDPETSIRLTSGRAKHCRWFLKVWTPREWCFCVLGFCTDRWYVENAKLDVRFMLMTKGQYDEARIERYIAAGKRIKGVTA